LTTEEQQEQKQQQQEQINDEDFRKTDFKIGPQFALADQDDDPLYKILPDMTVVEPVTKPKAETITRKVFLSGNARLPTLHLPRYWLDRLGLEPGQEIAIQLDAKWSKITIKKQPMADFNDEE
jgi:hypothetical protein